MVIISSICIQYINVIFIKLHFQFQKLYPDVYEKRSTLLDKYQKKQNPVQSDYLIKTLRI